MQVPSFEGGRAMGLVILFIVFLLALQHRPAEMLGISSDIAWTLTKLIAIICIPIAVWRFITTGIIDPVDTWLSRRIDAWRHPPPPPPPPPPEFVVPLQTQFEHTWIVAPSGH